MEWKKIESGMDKKRTKPFEAFSLSRCTTYNIMTKKKEKRHTEGHFRAHFSTMFANHFLFVLHAKQIAQKKKGFHSTCDMGFLKNIIVMICTIFLKL